MTFQRLRTDFPFATLILIGGIALLGIAPFAVFQLANGQLIAGAVDVAIMLSLGLTMAYVWRGGSVARASVLVAVTNTAGSVAIASVLGLAGVLWSYPAVLGNFLLLGRGLATLAAALIIAAQLWLGRAFLTPLQLAMYAATAAVVSAFALAFSYRADVQQQRLKRLADRDPLTGAYNRRAMDRELRIAMEGSWRHRVPVGLAVLDLDRFKRINDVHGHDAGDRVLIDFASLVASTTRKGDRFFRFGGEEFVLLLPGTDTEALRAVTGFLRARVADELRCEGEPVTVSIGAATLLAGEDATQWFARADAAMYQAKQQGRDRVVVDAAVVDPAAAMRPRADRRAVTPFPPRRAGR